MGSPTISHVRLIADHEPHRTPIPMGPLLQPTLSGDGRRDGPNGKGGTRRRCSAPAGVLGSPRQPSTRTH
jgi:hypothetical protein